MSKKIISGIGEIVWDMLPDGPRLGGAPFNFTFMADRLGAEGHIISAVGKDELGAKTLEDIRNLGLDTSGIQSNSFPTGKVLVTLDGKGIPQYEIIEGSSWDHIAVREEDIDIIRRSDAVCWGILSQRNEVSASTVRALLDAAGEDCMKVFDINIRQHYYTEETVRASLSRCDVLKLNEEEFPLLEKMFCGGNDDPIGFLSDTFDIDTIILTKGADCSEIFKNGELVSHIATPKVDVVDTVGAGDSFTACFVSGILSGKSIRESHEDAVRLSAYICTCRGAINEPKLQPEFQTPRRSMFSD